MYADVIFLIKSYSGGMVVSLKLEMYQNGFFTQRLSFAELAEGIDCTLSDKKIITLSENMGRGVRLTVNDGSVELYMQNPTCREEIEMVFDIAENVSSLWHRCIMVQDGREFPADTIPRMRAAAREHNEKILIGLLNKPDDVSITGTDHDLVLGGREKSELLSANNPVESFGIWLRRVRSMNVVFPEITFFGGSVGVVGRVAVPADTQCACPVKPSIPRCQTAGEADIPEISCWIASFYSYKEGKFIGDALYRDFLERFGKTAVRYDGKRVVIPPISDDEAAAIFDHKKEW